MGCCGRCDLEEGVWFMTGLTMSRVCLGHFECAIALSQVQETERPITSPNGHQVRLVWVPVQALHGDTSAGSVRREGQSEGYKYGAKCPQEKKKLLFNKDFQLHISTL